MNLLISAIALTIAFIGNAPRHGSAWERIDLISLGDTGPAQVFSIAKDALTQRGWPDAMANNIADSAAQWAYTNSISAPIEHGGRKVCLAVATDFDARRSIIFSGKYDAVMMQASLDLLLDHEEAHCGMMRPTEVDPYGYPPEW